MDRFHVFTERRAAIARLPVHHRFRKRPEIRRNQRRPTEHRFRRHLPERFDVLRGHQTRRGMGEDLIPFGRGDGAAEFPIRHQGRFAVPDQDEFHAGVLCRIADQ